MEQAVGTGMGLVIAILILAVFGAVVGWIAGLIVKGSGYGLLGDIAIGIAGAWIAGFAMRLLGLAPSESIVGAIIAAVIGAVVLLLIIKAVRRA